MNFIWYILIGILAGYFAGKIMRGGGFGLLVNLLLGIIGGVLGGWVFALLGLAATGIIGLLQSGKSDWTITGIRSQRCRKTSATGLSVSLSLQQKHRCRLSYTRVMQHRTPWKS